jgi:hypothetical protein
LPKPLEQLKLLLISEHQFASGGTLELKDEFGFLTPELLLDLGGHPIEPIRDLLLVSAREPDTRALLDLCLRRVLVDVSRSFAEAYDARIRESEGWAGLQRHLAALILRARELDPSLRAGATLGEALVVLKRHGEPLGISDEVLEIIFEMQEE